MALVFGGLGVLAIVTGYSPERSTRFGVAGPFFGEDARAMGWLLLCLGAAPLAFWARTAAQAGWWMALWLIVGVGGTLGQAYKLF